MFSGKCLDNLITTFTKIAKILYLETCGGLTHTNNAKAMLLALVLKEPRLERPAVSHQKIPSPYEKGVKGADANFKASLSITLTPPMSKIPVCIFSPTSSFPPDPIPPRFTSNSNQGLRQGVFVDK